MKGQTTIELKDVRTGHIDRFIDNNMMTNALSNIFATRGLMAGNAFTESNLVKACLGGIVLFDDELTESADNVFPPASVNMVGNASVDVTSSDSVMEMGSYNSNESGWQADGSFVAVYDFTTTQANGNIACVCLTSDIGGYIGYGNGSGNRKSVVKSPYEYAGTFLNSYGMEGYYALRMDYTNSTVDLVYGNQINPNHEDYFITTKKLKIEKYRIPMSKLSVKGSITQFAKISEIEVTIPDEFIQYILGASNYYRYIYNDEGNIYVYAGDVGTWTSGGTYKILKIDTSNQASVISIINTAGMDIRLTYEARVLFSGGYMIVLDEDGKIFRFAMADSSSIELTNPDSEKLTIYNDYFINQNGRIYTHAKVINVNQGTILYHNGTGYSGVNMLSATNHPLIKFPQVAGSIVPRMSALYLASINNLETPITKTSEKTMKVIYRIAF